MGYKEENGIVTKNAEMHFIELPKFIKKSPGVENQLDQWLWLLAGEGEKLEMAEKVNEKIKKAKSELDVMSMNEKEREIYEEIQLARMFYEEDIDTARKDGEAKGIKEEKRKIVKAMLKKKLPIEMIIEITKLSKEEIEKIEKETKEV